MLPDRVMRCGLHSSLFFTVSRMCFLLVRLVCMVVSSGLWHRLSNSLPWPCLNLFHLRGVAKPGPKPFHCAKETCARPHLESGTETHPSGKKSAGGSVSASSADTRRRGPWGSALLICCRPQPPHHLHLQFFRLVCFPIFRSKEKLNF